MRHDVLHARMRGGHGGRGKRGGKNERPRRVAQKVAHGARGAGDAAFAGHGLAERAHHNGHILMAEAEVLQTAASGGPQHARCVGVVHHQGQAVLAAQARQFRQAGDVAIHAENGIGDDKSFGGAGLADFSLQIGGVVVGVNHCARPRKAAAVNDAGVVQGVAENMGAGAAQAADDAHIGRVAAVEQQGGLAALEAGQQFFQPGVGRHVARNKA